jgi:hypothetical protein
VRGQLDSAEFEGLIGPDAGPEKLGAAVALWRGPAYDGLRDVPALRNAAERLDDLKLSTVERLIDVRLEAGRHHEVIAELAGLIAANPFRERLRAQLMTALYRSGRQAEALEQYRAIYRLLADEFGVAPTHELSELHQRILNGDADLHAPAAPARLVPRTLPLDVTRFSGRQDALAWLDKEADDGAPVVISAVAGTAGVGKTALATRWAHSVAHRFPDGQLFLNLRGYGPGEPLEEMQALTELLRLAGMAPQQIPPEPRAAADLLRSVLASRRVLVVLDNARSAEQVRPLLPGGPGNRVLITSRDSLLGLVALEGARRLVLNVLPVHDAVALLRSIVGDRVEEDAAGSVRLAERCGCLPARSPHRRRAPGGRPGLVDRCVRRTP